MASLRSIFTLETPYNEEKEQYIRFLNNNVSEFFSNVGTTRYKVSYLEVKSTINVGRVNYQGAKHRKLWKQLSNIISHNQTNTKYQNMHQAEIFKMIHDDANGSYGRLMNLVRKFIADFEDSDLQFNVVKYGYQQNFNIRGGIK